MSVPVTANLFAALDTKKKKKSKVRVVRASERGERFPVRDARRADRAVPLTSRRGRFLPSSRARRKQIGGLDRETASPDRR